MEINFNDIQINDAPLKNSISVLQTSVYDEDGKPVFNIGNSISLLQTSVYKDGEPVFFSENNNIPALIISDCQNMNIPFEMSHLEEIPVPIEVTKEEVQEVSKEEVYEIQEEESKPLFSFDQKMILLFDVDGTLCPSSQEVDQEMKKMIMNIKSKYECDIGIVGGGTYEKIEKQLGKEFLKEFAFVFAECGSVVYNKERKILLKNNIRKHKLYSNVQKCMKHSLRFISESSYEIGGHFIDIRNGLIYISLVGMDASFDMREHFKKMDLKMGFRKRLLLQLHERCDKGIRVVYGGEVGISLYPKEWDKVQVLGYLKEYPVIHYFGDRYEEDGNDYQLIHHPKVIGHKVDGVNDTFEFLKSIL